MEAPPPPSGSDSESCSFRAEPYERRHKYDSAAAPRRRRRLNYAGARNRPRKRSSKDVAPSPSA